jgi:hypothetical protein
MLEPFLATVLPQDFGSHRGVDSMTAPTTSPLHLCDITDIQY